MIDLSILKDRKHIWISVSGGVDSASLLYLIASYVTDVEITPWCVVDTTRPGNDIAAQKIIDVVSKRTGFIFNNLIVDYITKEPGGNKNKLIYPIFKRMQTSGLYDCYVDALSAAPPIEEMKSTKGFYKAFKRITTEDRTSRDNITHKYVNKFLFFKPYLNIDKQDIADIYEDHDLMNDLFPLTESCVGRDKTPCMECFWCHEKYWAFGMYDMGQ